MPSFTPNGTYDGVVERLPADSLPDLDIEDDGGELFGEFGLFCEVLEVFLLFAFAFAISKETGLSPPFLDCKLIITF